MVKNPGTAKSNIDLDKEFKISPYCSKSIVANGFTCIQTTKKDNKIFAA